VSSRVEWAREERALCLLGSSGRARNERCVVSGRVGARGTSRRYRDRLASDFVGGLGDAGSFVALLLDLRAGVEWARGRRALCRLGSSRRARYEPPLSTPLQRASPTRLPQLSANGRMRRSGSRILCVCQPCTSFCVPITRSTSEAPGTCRPALISTSTGLGARIRRNANLCRWFTRRTLSVEMMPGFARSRFRIGATRSDWLWSRGDWMTFVHWAGARPAGVRWRNGETKGPPNTASSHGSSRRARYERSGPLGSSRRARYEPPLSRPACE